MDSLKIFINIYIRGYTMPICEICGMEVIKVYDCSQCEAKFCDECGDIKRKLCYDCLGWEDDDVDEEWDSIEGLKDSWDDDEDH